MKNRVVCGSTMKIQILWSGRGGGRHKEVFTRLRAIRLAFRSFRAYNRRKVSWKVPVTTEQRRIVEISKSMSHFLAARSPQFETANTIPKLLQENLPVKIR